MAIQHKPHKLKGNWQKLSIMTAKTFISEHNTCILLNLAILVHISKIGYKRTGEIANFRIVTPSLH
jgi:hypothetical protein